MVYTHTWVRVECVCYFCIYINMNEYMHMATHVWMHKCLHTAITCIHHHVQTPQDAEQALMEISNKSEKSEMARRKKKEKNRDNRMAELERELIDSTKLNREIEANWSITAGTCTRACMYTITHACKRVAIVLSFYRFIVLSVYRLICKYLYRSIESFSRLCIFVPRQTHTHIHAYI